MSEELDTYLVREVIYDGEYEYGATSAVSLYKDQEPTELAFIEEMYGKDSVYKDEWSKGWAFNADYRMISITGWHLIDEEDKAVLRKYGVL